MPKFGIVEYRVPFALHHGFHLGRFVKPIQPRTSKKTLQNHRGILVRAFCKRIQVHLLAFWGGFFRDLRTTSDLKKVRRGLVLYGNPPLRQFTRIVVHGIPINVRGIPLLEIHQKLTAGFEGFWHKREMSDFSTCCPTISANRRMASLEEFIARFLRQRGLKGRLNIICRNIGCSNNKMAIGCGFLVSPRTSNFFIGIPGNKPVIRISSFSICSCSVIFFF